MRHKIIFYTKDEPREQEILMSLIKVIEHASCKHKMEYFLDRSEGKTRTKYVFEFSTEDDHNLADKIYCRPAIFACEDCLAKWYGCLIFDADMVEEIEK